MTGASLLPHLLSRRHVACAVVSVTLTVFLLLEHSALGGGQSHFRWDENWDSPQPFQPEHPATEADRDRVEAVALFCAGRAHERREEYAEALRCYQRALRCDPQSAAIAEAAVGMAARLNHEAEAIRYALKAAELDGPDPRLLRSLGTDLTEQGDWPRAITFFEKAMAARQGKETADDILLTMEMARLYCLTEKYKQAAECFSRVLYALDHRKQFGLSESFVNILLRSPVNTYQLIGECFLYADRPQDALVLFKKVEQSSHNESLKQLNLARVYLKTGKPAEALAALPSALSDGSDEQGTTPYETLSDALGALGKKNELLGRLEKLRTEQPKNLLLGYYLAAQYRTAGDLDKAQSLYRDLLALKPTLSGYRHLADIYRQGKRYDELLSTLGEAMEKTSVLDVLSVEGRNLSDSKESMLAIIQAARRRLIAAPQELSYGMRLAVGLLSLEAKDYATAGEFFELALAVKPPAAAAIVDAPKTKARSSGAPSRAAEVLMVWGVGLLSAERPAEAAKVFQRGIDEKALPDDNPAFYFHLAGALTLAERPQDALAAARKAAEKKSDSARYASRTAWVLHMAKRYDDATKAYLQLIEKFDADHASPDTREVLRDARIALSNIAVIQENVADAEEWLEQVLDEFPDDDGALNDLGYLWADQNKHLGRAERMIRKAVATEPENLAYRDSLGWVLFRLGKYDEAVTELQKAVAGKKPDAVVLDHLGDAYSKSNRRDKAIESSRAAAEAFRNDKELKKAETVESKTRP